MSQPTRPPSPAVLAGIAIGSLLLGLLIFSSRRPTSDVREWTPADHDQSPGQTAQGPARPKPQPGKEAADLTELAWARSCTPCHGERGRGDGPQGPMVRAPDLTRADWQGRVTDEEIAQVIRSGRNSMPKFDLPPAVVEGLVKRIRDNRAK